MPYKSNNTNQQSKENKGGPAATDQPKAVGQLPVNDRDEATENRLEQEAQDAAQRHPNRNLEKPDLDKPAYGGGH
ncbi:hypothetical protein F0P96_08750 [Hymenobacter busanensis]|uniref:Uncharacterized protein n=1 Tax=Hymenobacter busanensis TaxID=2607656 RepID=A0A7L5A1F4_9BACT|nr:hypothetical protein [Hymenobacter busanensis]KAA9333063.1 hypothetical protein F0P96_08750 [Hymenobacter busanensis]QHJ08262.1 hypothetical protein GUY19_13575 [Hymenobacter busanensis]